MAADWLTPPAFAAEAADFDRRIAAGLPPATMKNVPPPLQAILAPAMKHPNDRCSIFELAHRIAHMVCPELANQL